MFSYIIINISMYSSKNLKHPSFLRIWFTWNGSCLWHKMKEEIFIFSICTVTFLNTIYQRAHPFQNNLQSYFYQILHFPACIVNLFNLCYWILETLHDGPCSWKPLMQFWMCKEHLAISWGTNNEQRVQRLCLRN